MTSRSLASVGCVLMRFEMNATLFFTYRKGLKPCDPAFHISLFFYWEFENLSHPPG